MADNLNIGGSLRQIILPYPEFKLGEIIDPYEHNSNNSEMIHKINQMVTVLNSFINGEANTSLSAMAIAMPGVDPIPGSDLETFIRALVTAIRSTTPGDSGAHFVQSAKIEGLPGENVWEQVKNLSELVTGLDAETGEIIDDEEQDTTLAGKIERLLLAFTVHQFGTDHDGRYFTKEEMSQLLSGQAKLNDNGEIVPADPSEQVKYLTEGGDFKGTWKGMTLERVMSATGTGFGKIEILNEDPINPEPGRIWIVTQQFVDNPFAPAPEEPEPEEPEVEEGV